MRIKQRALIRGVAGLLAIAVLSTLAVGQAPQAKAEDWKPAAGDCWIVPGTPSFWKTADGAKWTWGYVWIWCKNTRFIQVKLQIRDADPNADDDVTGIYQYNGVQIPPQQWVWVGMGTTGIPCNNNKDPIGKEELYTRAQIVVEYLKSPWIQSPQTSQWCS